MFGSAGLRIARGEETGMGMEPESELDTVGGRIVAARKEMGMRQLELADLIHVSERTMQAYESNEVEPFRKLRELSEVLGRSMSWILHGQESTQNPGDLEPILNDLLVEVREIRTLVASKDQP